MRKSRSFIPGITIEVDDLPAVQLSPEGHRALALLSGPRLAVIGRTGPKCCDCRDFERVVTRTGVAVCPSPVHNDSRPPLPTRPMPHERDGRTPQTETARPHPRRAALLAW
ncbi:hypothetical protein [Streptomyces mobaraensis]|nr:hypothetical protein [Streptomyces mobaraensis]